MREAIGRVTLPNGYWINSVHYRGAELRILTGADEEFFAESAGRMLPVERTTALLTRCVTHLDGVGEVTPEEIGRLTVGDREALLLHLRRLTLGERIQCVLNCPGDGCGEIMDLELKVSELLQPPYHNPAPVYEDTMESDHRRFLVRFRLPTGADQEAVAWQAFEDVSVAAEMLLRRCVLSVSDSDNAEVEWLPEVLAELPARMAELDPQAELILGLACPECRESFSAQFDVGTYLFGEIASASTNLYHQVHLLALHYHWSEADIMSMNTNKRQRYLNLLLNSLSQMSQA